MLSDRYFRIFGFLQTFAYYLNGSPFIWCSKKRRLYVTTYSYGKHAFCVSLFVVYGTFLFVQLIRFHMMKLTTEFYYYYLYALTVCAVFDTTAAYPFLRRPKLAAIFMTEFWRFLQDIQTNFMSTFDPNHSCSNMLFDALITYTGIACPLLGLLISFHYIFFPYWPCYMTSLVPLEYRSPPLVVLNGILYFYGLQVVWAVLLSQVVCFLTYGWYFWLIFHEYYCFPENPRGPPGIGARRIWHRQKADPAFRTFEEFPVRYRQFQILHLNFQEVFSSMIIPLQCTITYLGVFCNFSLIKHKDNLSLTNTLILLIWSVGGTGSALLALTYCGTMYRKSVRALNTVKNKDWGSSHKNKIMRRIVRSCNPISYGYGRMYVIRLLSVFRFVKHLTRGTFRALLTLYK